MGINKSGITDPAMMIRGGHVIVDSDGLTIAEGINPQGLTHPPATTESAESAALAPITDSTTTIDVPRPELRTIYSTTIPARIKDAFADGEAIIFLCRLMVMAIPAIIVAVAISVVISVIIWVTANAVAIGTAIVAVLALAALLPILLGGRGRGGGTVTVKGCAKSGFAGPVTIRR